MKLTSRSFDHAAAVLHDPETASDIATIHPTGTRATTQGRAARLAACWNACHGLDFPDDIPAGAVANLVAAARDIFEGPMEGHVRADEPDSFETRAKRLAAALAAFTGDAAPPVSPDTVAPPDDTPDRRPVWSFEVDGKHVRWCGTLDQWHKDRLAYVDKSEGEWKARGPRRCDFIERPTKEFQKWRITVFRAVKNK